MLRLGKDIITIQRQKADIELANYNFGEDVVIDEVGSWSRDTSREIDDWTCICYISFEEGGELGEDRVSFHVNFKANTTSVLDAYAYLISNGGEIGWKTSRKALRVKAQDFSNLYCPECGEESLGLIVSDNMWPDKRYSATPWVCSGCGQNVIPVDVNTDKQLEIPSRNPNALGITDSSKLDVFNRKMKPFASTRVNRNRKGDNMKSRVANKRRAEGDTEKEIYYELKEAGVPLDSHESDLYAKVTDISKGIIDKYQFKSNVKMFRNQIDGTLWYDIPFQYAPFWESKRGTKWYKPIEKRGSRYRADLESVDMEVSNNIIDEEKANKPRSITIIGKRWFDKIYGNTYFSSTGYIDGEEVVHIPFEYGYDEQYLYRTWEEMIEKGFIYPMPEKYKSGPYQPAWQWCQDNGVKLVYNVSDVSRKRDLQASTRRADLDTTEDFWLEEGTESPEVPEGFTDVDGMEDLGEGSAEPAETAIASRGREMNRRAKKSPYTRGEKIMIYSNPENQTGMEGEAKLIKRLKSYPEKYLEEWEIQYTGDNYHSSALISTHPRVIGIWASKSRQAKSGVYDKNGVEIKEGDRVKTPKGNIGNIITIQVIDEELLVRVIFDWGELEWCLPSTLEVVSYPTEGNYEELKGSRRGSLTRKAEGHWLITLYDSDNEVIDTFEFNGTEEEAEIAGQDRIDNDMFGIDRFEIEETYASDLEASRTNMVSRRRTMKVKSKRRELSRSQLRRLVDIYSLPVNEIEDVYREYSEEFGDDRTAPSFEDFLVEYINALREEGVDLGTEDFSGLENEDYIHPYEEDERGYRYNYQGLGTIGG